MLWLIAIAIVIFLAFGASGLRTALKVAGGLIVLCILLIACYLAYDRAAKELAKNRIPLSEVRFDDLRLSIGSSGKLTGTVHNLSSRYTLTKDKLQITVRDCFRGNCDVVGQDTTNLYGLSVPPGQIRAVNQYVFFSAIPTARGEYEWDYQILTVEGE